MFLHPWNGHNLTTNGTTDDEPACARVFWADRQSLVVQYHTCELPCWLPLKVSIRSLLAAVFGVPAPYRCDFREQIR